MSAGDPRGVLHDLYKVADSQGLDNLVRSVTVRYDRNGHPVGMEVTTHPPLGDPPATATPRAH